MANDDNSFGLRAVMRDGAAGQQGTVHKYIIAATEGTDLFPGDPVNLSGTAILDLIDDKTYPGIVKTTAGNGNFSVGVIQSFDPITDESLLYKTDATLQRSVWVYDDPDQLFEIQADGTTALTDVGNTADFIFTNSGSTDLGLSGAELDTADIGTGKQLTIVGIRQQDNNDLSAANPILVVKIQEHQKRNLTGVN